MRTDGGSLSPPRSSVRKVTVRPPTLLSAATACAYCSSSDGQIGAFEIEELGAEQADRLGAQLDGDRDLLQHLDVGLQVDGGAVAGLRGDVAHRRQPLRARAGRVGARLVAAQRGGVGIQDHLAARAVDDDRHPRPDPAAQALDADDVGQAQRARDDGRVRRAAAALGAEPRRLGAAQLGGVGRRQLVRDGDAALRAPPRATRSRRRRPGCAAGARRRARRRSCDRGSTDPRCARTRPGSDPAPCAPPTRRRPCRRGSAGARARPGARRTASGGAPRGCGTAARRPRARRSAAWMRASCASRLHAAPHSKRAQLGVDLRRPRSGARECRPGSPARARRRWRSRATRPPRSASPSRIDPLPEPRPDQLGQRGDRGRRVVARRRRRSWSHRAPPPASAGP